MDARVLFLVALLLAVAGGCATTKTDTPPVRLPDGVDGYQCFRRETTPAGLVSAEAYPDYRGGYRMLSMEWQARSAEGTLLEAHGYWTHGPDAIAPPGWLSVSLTVDRLPPKHSKIRLQLRSGEFKEQDFVAPADWARRKKQEGRFRSGGNVHVTDPEFIEKFVQAGWADVSVVDSTGASYAQQRLDLAELPAALQVMRRLGDQVIADARDYEHHCGVIQIEVN